MFCSKNLQTFAKSIRLLYYLVQQSVGIALYAADVIHNSIKCMEFDWLVKILCER